MASLPPLRLLTCGSVDDGKSTLIGRLLHESENIFEDQARSLAKESEAHGTAPGQLDFALLLDGLMAEREQGITIDVAYRYFSTSRRAFIVADTPGHEQYTRNMATGSSTADLAILLVDARKGLLPQTHRHARIVAMMGIRHVVLAVNKMDLVGFDRAVFEDIRDAFLGFSRTLRFRTIQAIPLSALHGDNLLSPGGRSPWYQGPCLLDYLETVDVADPGSTQPFRMPIQLVLRPNQDFRGLAGRIAQGILRPGDAVMVQPSGRKALVREIVTPDGPLESACAGQSVTLTLDCDVDAGRGDVLADAERPCDMSAHFQARLLWMSDQPLVPGRPYLVRIQTRELTGTVSVILGREDVTTGHQVPARSLEMNEIAIVSLDLHHPVPYQPYQENRRMGAFILVDRITSATVGAGMIDSALDQARNLHWQTVEVTREARAAHLGQEPRCLWFTGLSGSGKSTLANMVEKRLHLEGRHTFILDGDNIRHGLNRDLGFSEADRAENIRRIAEVARLMTDAGLIVLVAFISPFRLERDMARSLFPEGEFIEIFVDAPLDVCETRDPKGLYTKARSGLIEQFTGIDSAYEAPERPELHLRTAEESVQSCVERILKLVR